MLQSFLLSLQSENFSREKWFPSSFVMLSRGTLLSHVVFSFGCGFSCEDSFQHFDPRSTWVEQKSCSCRPRKVSPQFHQHKSRGKMLHPQTSAAARGSQKRTKISGSRKEREIRDGDCVFADLGRTVHRSSGIAKSWWARKSRKRSSERKSTAILRAFICFQVELKFASLASMWNFQNHQPNIFNLEPPGV